jgi:hypothetical protein
MLKSLFHYNLSSFCSRYDISQEYVLNKCVEIYPQLAVESNLLIFICEVDLLTLLGFGSFSDIPVDDLRRESYIKLSPR